MSVLGIMMYIQKSIILNDRIIGWGYSQCTFVELYIENGLYNQCLNLFGAIPIDADVKHKMLVHDQIHTQFNINDAVFYRTYPLFVPQI